VAKRAFITGITGQDGYYLAESLLQDAYEVYGLVRGQTDAKADALRRAFPEIHIVLGDMLDQGSLIRAVDGCQPDEVYNLAAVSYVPLSSVQPELTSNVTGLGALRVLEAIRIAGGLSRSRIPARGVRFYQASSSEMFGNSGQPMQCETTPFAPRSPYAVAKSYAHYLTRNYRESYGLHAVAGILFNHESPRRGAEFVTRKVSLGVAAIEAGRTTVLHLGNLEARRDWGYAGDYVRAMRRMVNAAEPHDYVIGTGISYSVRDLLEVAFGAVGRDWRDHVVVDPALARPAEVDQLRADATAAGTDLGWRPTTSFEELITMMVESDLGALTRSGRS
jgi:GDPmannose 4,6-dehydratase